MLTDLGMAAAVVLAAVFAWAGAAKLGHPTGTADGFADLGLPWPHALARAVPVAELLLAVALLAAPRLGAIAALGLLAGFSTILVRALRRGVPVRCACFGRAGGSPLSPVDLLRNALLAAGAALALVAGTEPRVPRLAALAVAASAALAGAALLNVLRRRLQR